MDVHTAKYNLSNFADARLTFDVAYVPYGYPYVDSLAVLASTDCGATFTQLYKRGGDDLSTVPGNNGNYFIPGNDEWRTDTVSLDGFTDNPEVVIAFRNIGYYGNVLYIDNINLTSSVLIGIDELNPSTSFTISPNPNDGQFIVTNASSAKNSITVMNSLGSVVLSYSLSLSSKDETIPVDLRPFGKGIYFVKLEGKNGVSVKKVVVE